MYGHPERQVGGKKNNHTFLNEKVEEKEKALAFEIKTFWRLMRI